MLEQFYGALFRPMATFKSGAALSSGFGAIAITAFVLALAAAPRNAALGYGLLFLILSTYWALTGAARFTIARALGHSAEWRPLMGAFGLSFLPLIFLAPLMVFADWGLGPLAALGGLMIVVWWIRLTVAALQGVCGLSVGRAVIAIALADLGMWLAPIIFFCLVVAWALVTLS